MNFPISLKPMLGDLTTQLVSLRAGIVIRDESEIPEGHFLFDERADVPTMWVNPKDGDALRFAYRNVGRGFSVSAVDAAARSGAPPSYVEADPSKLKTCLVCKLEYDPSSTGFYTYKCEGCDPNAQVCCWHGDKYACGGCCVAGTCDTHL